MRPLTLDSLNQQLQTVQYAVRGELAIKAETYRDQLKSGGHNLPFDKVISSNIGNPQQKGLDQPPITFTRQVGNPFLTSYNNLLEFMCHPSGRRPNGMACARRARPGRVPRRRHRPREGAAGRDRLHRRVFA